MSEIGKELSQREKQQLDRILDAAREYLQTPEGVDMFHAMERLIGKRVPVSEVILTSNESKALTFIRRELKRGNSPSVREVTKAAGLKSSRSGQILIRALISKSVIKRIDGKLTFMSKQSVLMYTC